ncbi:MAG: DNA gyrase subunit A, partial [Firmicutes bacterium]|nr:DNA gyrase subunit A [Bacillota bacterium]
FVPNFDESLQEPLVLPAKVPNLLINGSAGIAVGMATNIPPHNLGEVVDALVYLIEHPDAGFEELWERLPGPDFPTGGQILGRDGIRAAYTTGRGILTIRGQATVEETRQGRQQIVITEIPYQVNKARLVEKIAELVRERRIEGIADLRDESDRHGVRVVIDLKRDAVPKVILNQIYKYTPMEQTFGIILLALKGGRPLVLTLREMLEAFLDHRKEVVVRRTRFELRKAEARAHILEGLRIALQFLDEVIALIRAAASVEAARTGLMERFGLTEVQATAILEMRLQRLTALEREKIEAEYQDLLTQISRLKAILADERLVYDLIKQELLDLKQRFGDARRTKIGPKAAELTDEDLIPEEDMVVTVTHRGYIKRTAVSTYRAQRRGGRGVTGSQLREDDFITQLFVASTHTYLCFFTNRGRIYRLKVHEIPEAGRQAKGTAIVNLLALEGGERVTAVQTLAADGEGGYWLFATRRGVVKRTPLTEYDSWRGGGIIAIDLDPQDELIGVSRTDGSSEVILGTRDGQVIRFAEEEVRPMGRTARGVTGIRLRGEDEVVSLAAIHDHPQLLIISRRGFGKRTPVDQFRRTARGGMGVQGLRVTAKTGGIAGIAAVSGPEEFMVVSSDGTLIRLAVASVSEQGRSTQGVTLMRLEEGQEVAAVAVLVPEEGHDQGL